jgi:hypothetical protein
MKKSFIAAIPMFAVCALFVVVFGSCGKKGNPAPPPLPADQNTLALTSGPWKLSLWEVKQDDGSWLSLALTDYQKSRVRTYNADHSFTSSVASNLGGTINGTGTWKFVSNETAVEMDGSDGTTSTTDIGALSATSFQEKAQLGPYPLPDANSVITTYHGVRFTWGH